MINDSRSREGLDPFQFDMNVSEHANTFANTLLENKFRSVWDLNGKMIMKNDKADQPTISLNNVLPLFQIQKGVTL